LFRTIQDLPRGPARRLQGQPQVAINSSYRSRRSWRSTSRRAAFRGRTCDARSQGGDRLGLVASLARHAVQWRFVMGRLRVLLIVALAVSPVTADLGHGLSWSKASGQKGGIYPSGRRAKTTGRSRCVCPTCTASIGMGKSTRRNTISRGTSRRGALTTGAQPGGIASRRLG
jgi:hypothetical protein